MTMASLVRSFTGVFGSCSTRSAGRRARPAIGFLAAAAALAGTLTFGVSSGMAATAFTDYSTNFTRVESPDPQATGRWSERLATVPDLNGDGKNEILVGDLSEDFSGFTNAGRVYMQDGATRRLMYSIDAPEIQANANFGFFISVLGDVNGDGKADFAAGTDSQDTTPAGAPCSAPPAGSPPTVPAPVGCNRDQGKAWVFSGASGATLYALNNPNPQANARFGSRIGRAGDVNGNGTPDVIVGASNNDTPAGCGNDPTSLPIPAASLPPGCRVNEGESFIFEGATGTLIRTLNVPAADRTTMTPCSSNCGSLGLAVQGIGDVNSDGVTDQLVDASSFSYDTDGKGVCPSTAAPTCMKGQGAMYLFSGKDGTFIRRIDDPAPQAGVNFGFQDAAPLSPGDVNRDGAADVFGNGFDQNGPAGVAQGRAWIFNGKTGAVLYELPDPTPVVGGQFAFSEDKTDYNQDGTPDIYAGKAPHDVSAKPCNPPTITTDCGSDQSGGTYIFNGRDGSLLKSLVLPASDAQRGESNNLGSNLGWSLAAPGDLNGDGQPDYVAGSPWTDVGPSAFNCQASTPGCVKDVGREFFFYSNVPAASGGGGGPIQSAPVAQSACAGARRQGPIVTSAVNNTARQLSRATSSELLAHDGFSMSVNAIRPGTTAIRLIGPRGLVIASARHTFRKTRRLTLKIHLTKAGRSLLRKLRRHPHRPLKVRLTMKFDTKCNYAPSRSKSVRIKR